MYAKLIDYMGSDLTIVNAARVSFDKRKEEFDPEKDTRLIRYLAQHNHWTPFGHAQATFHVKAPIFVARQLGKHQVGLVWNEVSRRYVDSPPEFWWPEEWRGRPEENKKQGSSDSCVDMEKVRLTLPGDVLPFKWDIPSSCQKLELLATSMYEQFIKNGVTPEQARILLPQNMYTEWYWTGSLAAFARIYKLRADPHTQKETRDLVVGDFGRALTEVFPVSWEALVGAI